MAETATQYNARIYRERRDIGYSWACAKNQHADCSGFQRGGEPCTCSHHAHRDLTKPRDKVELGMPGVFLFARDEAALERLGWLVRDEKGRTLGLSAIIGGHRRVLTLEPGTEEMTAQNCDDWNLDV